MTTKSNYKYVITTGWWCVEHSDANDSRAVTVGSDETRSATFFRTWHAAVDRFTRPVKILVVDSASPTRPELPADSRIEFLSLDRNAGHASNHCGKWSGFTLSNMCGMIYALCCDVDYWVYIEQDALVYGENIIETAISKMRKPYMWGSGRGTPQPIQQSMMIVKKCAIPTFLKTLASIDARDADIFPEVKFALASSPLLRWLPEWVFYQHGSNALIWRAVRSFRRRFLFRYAGGFDVLPFGYGRQRPINFSDKHFYFQHGSSEELEGYFKRISEP